MLDFSMMMKRAVDSEIVNSCANEIERTENKIKKLESKVQTLT